MPRKVCRFIYWTPRVASMAFILFLALFSLDVFEMKLGFWGTVVGLFMHNIPSLVLLAVLVVSWKYELVGGIAFIFAGLFYIAGLMMTQFEWFMLSWSLTIAGPAFLIGILFLMNWFKKKGLKAA